jgi:predicted GNAT family acetyltransferase
VKEMKYNSFTTLSQGGIMSSSEKKTLSDVIHKADENRFVIQLEDSIAFLSYQVSNDDMIFLHTETPPQHEGKGIGSSLVQAGLEYAKAHFYRVVPLCSFTAAYISRHPEYQPLLRK